MLGTEIMIAVSAPTSLAIRMAEQSGITLIAVARADGFEIFTYPTGYPVNSFRERLLGNTLQQEWRANAAAQRRFEKQGIGSRVLLHPVRP